MINNKELKKFLLENCVDDDGNLDLSGLDFSDFDGDINISHMKAKKNLIQNYQEVKGDLLQDSQKVQGDLWQNEQEVKGDLWQDRQKVQGDIWQSLQEVQGDLLQNRQKVKGKIYQDEKNDDSLNQDCPQEQDEISKDCMTDKEITINNFKYKVIFVEKTVIEDTLGTHNSMTHTIEILKGLSYAQTLQTTIHELTHAYLWAYGFNEWGLSEEAMCNFIGVYAPSIVNTANEILGKEKINEK